MSRQAQVPDQIQIKATGGSVFQHVLSIGNVSHDLHSVRGGPFRHPHGVSCLCRDHCWSSALLALARAAPRCGGASSPRGIDRCPTTQISEGFVPSQRLALRPTYMAWMMCQVGLVVNPHRPCMTIVYHLTTASDCCACMHRPAQAPTSPH